ncbi:hypothetical protein GCM10027271_04560 [Saccharopolyspora gloriosae]|uniref:Uncharacterized protein n=1 Tax=Saccharopolyspora gloriosae TaxID=455344 RepID=A0A840NPU8_9PSEU|nr:hypothetical protein [Saccharopolyspora gloriosae]MBB5072005.1 hypothetical protein [Saccharopolyspora gloriosae]
MADDARDETSSAHRPDTPLLVAGALALTVSGSVLFGGSQDFWIEWSLAGAAVLVGIFLLIASMRRRDR